MQPCKILIVEDELLVATDLEATLSRAGHHVVGIADDYDQALHLSESILPDLVLMDIKLRGEKTGVAAALAIRERWQIPVVFLTANADEQTLANARGAGPYGFLTKPFRNEELTEAVRIAIGHHQSAQHLFAAHRWVTTVLDSLTDAVIATDSEARVRYLNPAAEALTGWDPIDSNGRNIEEVYPLSDSTGTHVKECLLKRALASGAYVGKERFTLTTRRGAKIPIEDSAAPIFEGGRIVGAVTIFLDITKMLSSEQKRESERDRLEEAASVAAEALGHTRSELRALSADLMRTQEQERHRIARELHDGLGQQAAILAVSLDQIAQATPSVAPEITRLKTLADQLATGLRDVSHRLHPAILSDLGLSVALQDLVSQQRELGRDVHYFARAVPELIELQTATALYRIAQEGLSNATKYAPDAGVRLSLTGERNELQLRIEDTGCGFSVVEARNRKGLGLINMQERAHLAGGSLQINSRPGDGTVLVVRVPLKAASAGE